MNLDDRGMSLNQRHSQRGTAGANAPAILGGAPEDLSLAMRNHGNKLFWYTYEEASCKPTELVSGGPNHGPISSPGPAERTGDID